MGPTIGMLQRHRKPWSVCEPVLRRCGSRRTNDGREVRRIRSALPRWPPGACRLAPRLGWCVAAAFLVGATAWQCVICKARTKTEGPLARRGTQGALPVRRRQRPASDKGVLRVAGHGPGAGRRAPEPSPQASAFTTRAMVSSRKAGGRSWPASGYTRVVAPPAMWLAQAKAVEGGQVRSNRPTPTTTGT